jgi:hypothetical protein
MHAAAPSAIAGLSWASHKVFFLAWAYTGIGLGVAYKYRQAEKAADLQERVSFYMESGHYKHPWAKSKEDYTTSPKLAALKKVDYTKLIAKPQ